MNYGSFNIHIDDEQVECFSVLKYVVEADHLYDLLGMQIYVFNSDLYIIWFWLLASIISTDYLPLCVPLFLVRADAKGPFPLR